MDGAGAWETAGQFPKAISGLRGVSLNNNIFMTGNIIVNQFISHKHSNNTGGYSDSILRFNSVDGSWEEVGKLQQMRHDHGASLVNVDDIMGKCV